MAGSKKRQFAINAASGFADQGVRIGVGFVMLPYLMWRLGLEVYGISQLAQSALVFFGFLQLGMGPTLVRFCSQAIAQNDQDEIRRVSSTAQTILGSLGTLGMLGIIGFIPFFLKIYEIPAELTFEVSVLLLCMAVSFLLNFILLVPQGLAMGSNRYDLVNAIGITGTLLRFGLIVLTFELLGPSILLLGVCILLAQVFRIVSLFVIAFFNVGRPAFFSTRSVNRTTMKSLFGFSVLNLVNAIAASLIIQGPVLIIGKTLGPEMVAMFAPAILVATSLQGILGQITSPLVPLASQAQAENNQKKIGHWSILIGSFIAVVGLAIALPLCVFGSELIARWLGSGMSHIWVVVAIMATGTSISQTAAVLYSLSLGGGCIRPMVYSQVVLGIVTAIGVVIGTWLLGWQLIGLAIFLTACRCSRNVFYLTYAYSKQFFYSVPNYLWLVYAKSLLVFLVAVGGGFLLRTLVVPDSLILLAAEAVALLLVYSIVAWHFVLSIEIKSSVRKVFPAFRKS